MPPDPATRHCPLGAQEAGSEEEPGAFCQKNYNVGFPMFAKIELNGPAAYPL